MNNRLVVGPVAVPRMEEEPRQHGSGLALHLFFPQDIGCCGQES